MRRRNTRWNATQAAAAAQVHGMTIEQLGISDAQWEMLDRLWIARLGRHRGIAASTRDPVLGALYRRGLVDGRDLEGLDGWLWFLTDEGRKLAKGGKPAE